MRQTRAHKSNQRFMFGMIGMAVVVLAVVALFLLWASPDKKEAQASDEVLTDTIR